MIEAFLAKALIAGVIVAIVSGVMGCFVVWRRMAYFGDSLAHSALLGIAMGVLLNISHNLAVMLVCICFALVLMWLQRQKVFACSGIVRYLFFLGKPAVVHPDEIDQMQNHLNGVYKDIKVTTLSVGDSHTISEGPFSGVSGKVVQTDNKKVKLELVSLGMSITLKK